MTLGIVIATYQRIDGTTPKYLETALKSIKNQTYSDYKVFLIGDKYENNEEFESLAKSIIPTEKIFWTNLPFAKERDKYPLGDLKLWCAGGVNALNFGISQALNEKIDYLCHLDHDDWWEPNHLSEIFNAIKKDNPFMIATKSTYKGNKILPQNPTIPYYPKNGDLIHSSTCINFKKCTLRYRDVYAEEGRVHAADGDLWERITKMLIDKNDKAIFIDKITCHHEKERY